MDDITWVVEGTSLDDVIRKLEQCTEASLRWASDNAVRFETSETKPALFSRRRKHRRCERNPGMGPGHPLRSGGNMMAAAALPYPTTSSARPSRLAA